MPSDTLPTHLKHSARPQLATRRRTDTSDALLYIPYLLTLYLTYYIFSHPTFRTVASDILPTNHQRVNTSDALRTTLHTMRQKLCCSVLHVVYYIF